ncbi:2-succinylbenzoate-CoA ligase, partial [Bacillus sp. mrc49]
MARRLASAGLKAGDSCAVLLRNHIDGVITIHALFYLGVKIVMLNNKLTAKELSWQVEDSGASYLLSEGSFASKLDDMAGDLLELPLLFIEQLPNERTAEILQEFYLEDTATIMYTS